MSKILFYASFEIILGAIILYFNLKSFLLYFLIIYFINSHLRTESLAKAIRVQGYCNSIATISIMQKLNITDEDLEVAKSKLKTQVNQENWDLLMKDFE